MATEHKISICLGSSCFSRGNGKTLQIIKDFIEKNQLDTSIDFRGKLCTDNCADGPIIEIDGTIYKNISSDNILYILDSLFMK